MAGVEAFEIPENTVIEEQQQNFFACLFGLKIASISRVQPMRRSIVRQSAVNTQRGHRSPFLAGSKGLLVA